jgi:hypothetical protein
MTGVKRIRRFKEAIGERRARRKAERAGKRPRAGVPAAETPAFLAALRKYALIAVAIMIGGVTLVSFGESYRGLYLWAIHHDLPGLWAAVAPMMVDVFIGVGEMVLLVAVIDRLSVRARVPAWLLTLTGLAASVAGNVGHVDARALSVRVTAGVPPVAAAAALAVGLGILKHVIRKHAEAADGASPAVIPTDAESAAMVSLRATLAAGNPWSQNQLEARFGLSRTQAKEVRERVLAESNGHLPVQAAGVQP